VTHTTHTHTPPYSRRNEYGISLGHPIKKRKKKESSIGSSKRAMTS